MLVSVNTNGRTRFIASHDLTLGSKAQALSMYAKTATRVVRAARKQFAGATIEKVEAKCAPRGRAVAK